MKCGACGQINVHEALVCTGCGGALEDWNPQSALRKSAMEGLAPSVRKAPAKDKGNGGGFLGRGKARAGIIPVKATSPALSIGSPGLGNAGIVQKPATSFDSRGMLRPDALQTSPNAGMAPKSPTSFDTQGMLRPGSVQAPRSDGVASKAATSFDTQGMPRSGVPQRPPNEGIAPKAARSFDSQGVVRPSAVQKTANQGISPKAARSFDTQGMPRPTNVQSPPNAGLQTGSIQNVGQQAPPPKAAETAAGRPYQPPGVKQEWSAPRPEEKPVERPRAQERKASGWSTSREEEPQTPSPGGVEGWTSPPPGTPSWSRTPTRFTQPSLPADLGATPAPAEEVATSASEVLEVASGYRGLVRSYGVSMACYFVIKMLGNVSHSKGPEGALVGLIVMGAVLAMIGAVVMSVYNGMRLAGPVGCSFHPALLLVFLVFPMASVFVVGALLFTTFPWLHNRGVAMTLLGPDDATLTRLRAKASNP